MVWHFVWTLLRDEVCPRVFRAALDPVPLVQGDSIETARTRINAENVYEQFDIGVNYGDGESQDNVSAAQVTDTPTSARGTSSVSSRSRVPATAPRSYNPHAGTRLIFDGGRFSAEAIKSAIDRYAPNGSMA